MILSIRIPFIFILSIMIIIRDVFVAYLKGKFD